jgi:hypothetical protein
MVGGLHSLYFYETEQRNLLQLLYLSGEGKGLMGRDGGGDLMNIQCKPIQNCCNESPVYNEYVLIEMKKRVFI